MKRKVWEITVLDNPNRAIGGENDQFYTTDTEAFLIFNLADENFSPTEAMLTLVNSADRSVISETAPVVDGTIEWEMREEIIEHAGNWQAQLVYKQMKDGKEEKYTSQIVTFNVSGHLLDTHEVGLVAIENWNNFVKDAEDLFADWADLEEIRQLNEEQRIINEEARQENYNELVDTGIMQENINQKLADAEQEYAPRLTELEQNDENLTAQLAQTANKVNDPLLRKTHISYKNPTSTEGFQGDVWYKLKPFYNFENDELEKLPTGWSSPFGGGFRVREVDDTKAVCSWRSATTRSALRNDDLGIMKDSDIKTDFYIEAKNVLPSLMARISGEVGTENGYLFRAQANNTTEIVDLFKYVNGEGTSMVSLSMPFALNTWYTVRLRVVGNELYGKIWLKSETEPEDWTLTTTDNSLADGHVGIFDAPGNGVSYFDNWEMIEGE